MDITDRHSFFFFFFKLFFSLFAFICLPLYSHRLDVSRAICNIFLMVFLTVAVGFGNCLPLFAIIKCRCLKT